jgi:hypothetical protein
MQNEEYIIINWNENDKCNCLMGGRPYSIVFNEILIKAGSFKNDDDGGLYHVAI